MSRYPKYNASGYPDPTPYQAIAPTEEEEAQLQARTRWLIDTLKGIIELAGYDLLARVEIRDRESGRVFR